MDNGRKPTSAGGQVKNMVVMSQPTKSTSRHTRQNGRCVATGDNLGNRRLRVEDAEFVHLVLRDEGNAILLEYEIIGLGDIADDNFRFTNCGAFIRDANTV